LVAIYKKKWNSLLILYVTICNKVYLIFGYLITFQTYIFIYLSKKLEKPEGKQHKPEQPSSHLSAKSSLGFTSIFSITRNGQGKRSNLLRSL